jgi:hypothetical protein
LATSLRDETNTRVTDTISGNQREFRLGVTRISEKVSKNRKRYESLTKEEDELRSGLFDSMPSAWNML